MKSLLYAVLLFSINSYAQDTTMVAPDVNSAVVPSLLAPTFYTPSECCDGGSSWLQQPPWGQPPITLVQPSTFIWVVYLEPTCEDTYHDNGRLASHCQCKDSVVHGTCTNWDQRGRKTSESIYDEGTIVSTTNWNHQGMKTSVSTYKEGKLRKTVHWGGQGNILYVRHYYSNGQLSKYSQRYDNGQLEEVSHYDWFGEKHGVQKQWYRNGNLKQHATYVHGFEHGKKIIGDEYTEDVIIVHMTNGQMNGPYEQWVGGELRNHGTYTNGRKTGLWIEHKGHSGDPYNCEVKYNSSGQLESQTCYYGSDQETLRSEQFGYSQGRPHGKHIDYYTNGQKKSEFRWTHGLRLGNVKTWYESGQLWQDLNYTKRGFLFGHNEAYDQHGHRYVMEFSDSIEMERTSSIPYAYRYKLLGNDTLAQEVVEHYEISSGTPRLTNYYQDGRRHGEWRFISSKSLVINKKVTYNQGNLTGPVMIWDDKLIEHGQYNDGVRSGNWRQFVIRNDQTEVDTVLATDYNYQANQKHGVCRQYKNGLLALTETYDQGVLNGFWQRKWPGTGEIIEEGEYVAGKKHGYWQRHLDDLINEHCHDHGIPAYQGSFDHGVPHGPWMHYETCGQLEAVGEYHRGVRQGRWTFYYLSSDYPNVKQAEGLLENGEKVGRWKYYHPNGRISQRINHGKLKLAS